MRHVARLLLTLPALLSPALPQAQGVATPLCVQAAAQSDDLRPQLRPVKLLRLWQAGSNGVPINTQLIMVRSLPQAVLQQELARADSLGGTASDLFLSHLVFESAVDIGAGRQAEAETRLSQCMAVAEKRQDRPALAACTVNLGVLRGQQQRFAEADTLFAAAEQLYTDWATAPALDLRAVETHPNGWTTASDDAHLARLGAELALLNRGNLSMATGQVASAEGYLDQAARRTPGCGAAARADLARLYLRVGRVGRIGRAEPKPVDAVIVGRPGFESEAMPLGDALPGSASPAAATLVAAHVESIGARTAAGLQQLQARIDTQLAAGQWASALDGLATLTRRAMAAGRPDIEFSAHAQRMRVLTERGRVSAAILHGKLAVNLAQEARRGLADAQLPREARRSLLRERQGVYTQLAQLLLAQDRLAEAESTLQLSKEEEGRQFIDSSAAFTPGSLALLDSEAAAKARDDAAASELRALDARRSEVARRVALGAPSLMDGRAKIEARLARLGDVSFEAWADSLQAQGADRVRESARRLPTFLHESLLALLDNTGQRLQALLQGLIDDAREFRETPLTPAQMRMLRSNLAAVPRLQALLLPPLQDTRAKGPSLFAQITAGKWLIGPSRTAASGSAPASAPTALPSPAPRPASAVAPVAPLPMPAAAAAAADSAADGMSPVADLLYADALAQLWRIAREGDQMEARHRAIEAEVEDLLRARSGQVPAGLDRDSPSLLARASPRSAIVYYLPGPAHLDILLVDRQGRRAWRVPVKSSALDRDLDRFLAQLRDPASDPRPLAQTLYDTLIAPLAGTLRDKGIDHVVLCLNGRLRFMPFAALHDGQRWLGERLAFSTYVGGRLQSMVQASSPNWTVAAFGASAGGQGLTPLPGVRKEIEAVAARGRAWLDGAFTRAAMQSTLGGPSRYRVVHIASHFSMQRGDPERSFLLLGDGGRLSLGELAGPAFSFDGTELVTLSACETALSADDAFGQEVDGLGALLMGRGARSVIASLWTVSDDSTATLMSRLYAARPREGAVIAQALRSAQAEWIAARPAAPARADSAPDGDRGAVAIVPGSKSSSKDGAQAPALGRAHPYYWAPFVLMGNWL
jgi:CHAT domain-containing protein